MKQRVLVIAHAHPDFSLGGGELAAYQLYKALSDNPEVESATFVGAHGTRASGALRLRRAGEYLWEQGTGDSFLFKSANLQSTMTAFRELVERLRPTAVFVHHYLNLGLEMLRVLRAAAPGARIVMTLHEMLAICRNDGQMVKPGSMKLCRSESPEECQRCFPERSMESFWLRKRFILKHFALVDHFVAPSHFIRERYVAWGLAGERVSVVENGQAAACRLMPRPLASGERRGRFAFFGQINPYKGVDMLLEALLLIPPEERRHLSVEIHGANLELQKEDFQKRIGALRDRLEPDGLLHWRGPYLRDDLAQRMRGIDWLLVPSVWWENSPMVIQEAYALNRPVICSGIGGMAEKVRHDVDGYHVEANNPRAWADALVGLARDGKRWDRYYKAIRHPLSHAECAARHLQILQQLQAPPAALAPRARTRNAAGAANAA